jgi:hypothetical protein
VQHPDPDIKICFLAVFAEMINDTTEVFVVRPENIADDDRSKWKEGQSFRQAAKGEIGTLCFPNYWSYGDSEHGKDNDGVNEGGFVVKHTMRDWCTPGYLTWIEMMAGKVTVKLPCLYIAESLHLEGILTLPCIAVVAFGGNIAHDMKGNGCLDSICTEEFDCWTSFSNGDEGSEPWMEDQCKFFDTMTWLRQFSDRGGTKGGGGARRKEKIVKGGSSKWFEVEKQGEKESQEGEDGEE